MKWQGLGLRRSGSHVIGDWILSGIGGKMVDVVDGKVSTRERTNTPGLGIIYMVEDADPDKVPYDGMGIPYVHHRDIYNLAASRLKTTERWKSDPIHGWRDWVVDLWKRWSRDDRFPKVLLNRLIEDVQYRRDTERLLKIEARDEVLGIQSGPSGFGEARKGQKRDPRSSLTRYESIELPDWLLRDEELQELNLNLYGWYLDGDQKRREG